MPVAKSRQQGSSIRMIWTGIVFQTIIVPFEIDKIKLNSDNYWDSMGKTVFAWYKSLSHNFKIKCVFLHDNASSCASKIFPDFF